MLSGRLISVSNHLSFLTAIGVALGAAAAPAAERSVVDFARARQEVESLGALTTAPEIFPADGFAADGTIRPLFFVGQPWQGKPTRVFAWLGMPANRTGKVPGVVLVHGGGGTAYKEWVRKWNEQGFAAIAMGLEGQTDERVPDAPREAQWRRHAWAGPARKGIYGDFAEPLPDQWMYHAVADVVLAHSLLRAQPEVDAAHIGVCGISWGGIVTATVVGIDTRFAFGIPIYGCGALDRAPNQYGRALQDQALYREVWEPLQRMARARLPMLWLTGPSDQHFPLAIQQASYRAASGPRMVSVPFDMKHSHPSGWNPPDSYAFARAVVETGRPWARELGQEQRGGEVSVTFALTRPVQSAVLVYRRETEWERIPAKAISTADGVRLAADLPVGAKSWFFNGNVDGLTLSSELRSASRSAGSAVTFPGFSWDRVPLNLHFVKRESDLTDAELDFIARQSRFVVLE